MSRSAMLSLKLGLRASMLLAVLGFATPALGGPLISASLRIAAGALPPATFGAVGATGQTTGNPPRSPPPGRSAP